MVGAEGKKIMGPEDWRELCKEQGCSVWSMIVQLLHFAAKEDPEEFRRRRDGVAETLFSPELSRRHRSQPNHRCSGASSEHSSGEKPCVPSEWTPHAAASVVTECRKDSSQVTPPHTQSSQAGEVADSRKAHSDFQKKDGRLDHHSRVAARDSKPATAATVRVCEGMSAELPLPAAVPKGQTAGRQSPSDNCPPPEPLKDSKPQHKAGTTPQAFPREHVDRRHHEANDAKCRLTTICGKVSVSVAFEERKTSPMVELPPEQQDDDGERELSTVAEDALEELDVELVLKRVEDAKAVLLKKDLALHDIIGKLKELQDLPVTMDILQGTQIGKAVTKILKKNKNAEVQSLGSTLIREWKEVVTKSCSESEAPDETSPSATEVAEAPGEYERDAEGNTGEDEPHSWLAAPPLEDDVFAMDVPADLGFQNCLTDFDSLGSELSGSVASAGGHSLTNKTPESHRVFGSSESSPCETNRPLPGGCTGSQPQSVLSESVRKAGWNESGLHDQKDDLQKHQNEGNDTCSLAGQQRSAGVQKYRPHSGLTSTTQWHALPGPLRIEQRPAVPRPVLPKKPVQLDHHRLDLAKRKLHERSQETGEVKKFKTIQVVEAISEAKPKAKGKPFFKHNYGLSGVSRSGRP